MDDPNTLLSNAYALLHLITSCKPFGPTMLEAGACGLPVIATPRGSVPEIIKDGLTVSSPGGGRRAAAGGAED